jgi:hypothetical protein
MINRAAGWWTFRQSFFIFFFDDTDELTRPPVPSPPQEPKPPRFRPVFPPHLTLECARKDVKPQRSFVYNTDFIAHVSVVHPQRHKKMLALTIDIQQKCCNLLYRCRRVPPSKS